MSKIKVGPIVELQGDEMAKVVWDSVKEKLLFPHLNMELHPFDLSIENRDRTEDEITIEALAAIKMHMVGVKCSMLSPNADVAKKYNLKKLYEPPNKTLRNGLGCTIIREPIVCSNIPKVVKTWVKPIIIARHPQYDQYQATEIEVPSAGKLQLVFTSSTGQVTKTQVKNIRSCGVAMAMFNTESSIQNFARCCFEFALERCLPLFLTTKHTVMKVYDGQFMTTFNKLYEAEYKMQFEKKNITFRDFLIDEMLGKIVKSEGGFVWACKNYDGDIQSDAIAQGFGSSGLMATILRCPGGKIQVGEVFHGTIPKHYDQYKAGEETSTNPMSIIFAWANALQHRANLDDNSELSNFCAALKKTCIETIESGKVTKDLAIQINGNANLKPSVYVETFAYLDLLATNLKKCLEE